MSVEIGVFASYIHATTQHYTCLFSQLKYCWEIAINYRHVLIVVSLVTLVSCSREPGGESAKEPSSTSPNIPTLDEAQILDLSKIQQDEIERRCLGENHPTCAAMKSKKFKALRDFKKSLCEIDRTQSGRIEDGCRQFYN